MEQEDKELLLKDLCARLPYGVKCINIRWPRDGHVKISNIDTNSQKVQIFEDWCDINDCKPYLRPMSSMTEDERKYIEDKCAFTTIGPIGGKFCLAMPVVATEWLTDFYNSHYLDWRGLIQMGLALEASEGMYDIKEK